MRAQVALLAFMLAVLPIAAAAQPSDQPFLVLDQERFFTQSEFGRSLIARSEREADELRRESDALDRQFEAEERALTEQRVELAPDAFRELADAFDEKVIRARAEQEAKAQALASRSEARRREFFREAAPVLLRLLEDSRAGAIVEARSLLLSKQDLNITDEAIKRLDAAIAEQRPGDGGSAPDAPEQE